MLYLLGSEVVVLGAGGWEGGESIASETRANQYNSGCACIIIIITIPSVWHAHWPFSLRSNFVDPGVILVNFECNEIERSWLCIRYHFSVDWEFLEFLVWLRALLVLRELFFLMILALKGVADD